MGMSEVAHDIISDLMKVAVDLGRVPRREDYRKHGRHSDEALNRVFGSYTLALHASGLKYTTGKLSKQEVREQVFEAIKKESVFSATLPPPISQRALIISDFHAPYNHPDAIPFLLKLHEKYNFDFIGNVGDEVDQHGLSFHDTNPDLLSPGHELEAAIRTLEPLYKAFPNMLIADSNHGSLLYRKGLHHGIPRHVLKGYNDVLQAPPGWKWSFEFKVQFSNGDTAIVNHSYGGNILLESQRRGTSLIAGHIHSQFCIQKWANYDGVKFAMQVGWLGDDKSMAFAYNKTQSKRPILGVGAVFNGEPRLLPMILDAKNRWTGVVP